MKRYLYILIFSLLFLPLSGYAIDVPELKGYVNDYGDMISPAAKARLEEELRAFEQSDSTQIAILTIPSLEGDVLEEFSIRVGEVWKIGQQVKDNGIILIVSKEERKIRIEVGRGLEGKLTDLTAGRIIDLVIKPDFKRGDFDGGFSAGISSLIDATRGEFQVEKNHLPRGQKGLSPFFTFLIFGGIILVVLGALSRILGAIAGAIGLPLIVHLALLPLGLISFIVLAILGLGAGLLIPLTFSSRGYHRGGGLFPGGGFYGTGGGSFGGGFGGGGGFSGGGGGFGGGGASGDW